MKYSIKLAFIFTILFAFNTFGQEAKKTPLKKNPRNLKQIAKQKKLAFLKVKVVVYKGDTLGKIITRFVRDDSVINRKTAMVDKTLKSNPQIKNWKNLVAGQTLYLYLDPKFLDIKKMAKFQKNIRKASKQIKTAMKKKSKKKAKKWSAFYMASYGNFDQENTEFAKVNFKQNSPLTLGALYSHIPEKGNYSLSFSAYFSYLLAASSNVDTGDIDVPMEIGFNGYYQKAMSGGAYSLYGGLDFEKFNTFNLEGIQEESELLFDENSLGYVTIGYTKVFNIMKRNLLFKTSLSQSVFSSRSSGYSGESDDSSYSGQKWMLFGSMMYKKDIFISTLFKYHTLSGPSTVSSLRIGLGFGYVF